jgi:chemotaxis protein CheD
MDSKNLNEYILKPGFIFYTCEPTMILTVLGSSVAVTFYDRKKRCGGMNHFLFPWMQPEIQPTAVYAQPAVVQLLRMFHDSGSSLDNLEAHIIGGATPDGANEEKAEIGNNNVEAAVHVLDNFDIPIIGQEVGGRHGRKVLFNTETGELVIAKVEKIRKNDWYPDLSKPDDRR